MKKIYWIFLLLTMALLVSCGAKEPEEPQEVQEDPPVVEPVSKDEEPAEMPHEEPPKEPETYDDVKVLFAGICDGADLSASLSSSRIHVSIKTDWPEEGPEAWDEAVSELESALGAAHLIAGNYGAGTVSAEILSQDGSVLASGYNGKVQYTKFEERDAEIKEGTTYLDPAETVYESLDKVDEKLAEAQEGLNGGTGSDSSENASYVLNTSTMKFHETWCSSVEDIKAGNRSDYNGSRDDVISMGYVPCKKCNP